MWEGSGCLGGSQKKRDCIGSHGKIPWEGFLASLNLYGPEESLNC